jgi:hypothetical protein
MKLLFSGAIALILLGLYEYGVYEGIRVASCVGSPGCTAYNADAFTLGYAHALSGIGGLIAALVIAELAVTKPGEAPAGRVFGANDPNSKLSWTITVVTSLYMLVWLITGVAAYVVGTMWYPKALQPLTDLGQSWLGIAVAAGYSYFNITPEK